MGVFFFGILSGVSDGWVCLSSAVDLCKTIYGYYDQEPISPWHRRNGSNYIGIGHGTGTHIMGMTSAFSDDIIVRTIERNLPSQIMINY
jgi:hypothetical protein